MGLYLLGLYLECMGLYLLGRVEGNEKKTELKNKVICLVGKF